MGNYPNYRISVEILILHNHKVLVTKRADAAKLTPGEWTVPAGKVKYEEVPLHGLFREAKEETNLDVELIKELDVRPVHFKSQDGEDIYRVIYTYLVKPKNDNIESFQLNDEHSDYVWVDASELSNEKFSSMRDNLKGFIKYVLENYQI